jgi:hypothetical protein
MDGGSSWWGTVAWLEAAAAALEERDSGVTGPGRPECC